MSSSEIVKNYEMIDGHDYYTATICDEKKEDCQTLEDFYYVLKNAHPDSQTFPFATTPDNEKVLVPRRIMQDERGVQEFIFEKAGEQTCFDVSPQDDYAARVACHVASLGEKENEENAAKNEYEGSDAETPPTDSSSSKENTQNKKPSAGVLQIKPWVFALAIIILLALTGVLLYFIFSV